MPNPPPPPLMSAWLEILLAVAAISVTLMSAFIIYTLVYVKSRVDSIEKTVNDLKPEIQQILADGKILINRANAIADKVDKQMDNIDHVTSKARQWLDRASGIVEQVTPVVESPVSFLVNKLKSFQSFFGGVFQALKNP